MKKSDAVFLAIVCLLGGVFIGAFIQDTTSPPPVTRTINITTGWEKGGCTAENPNECIKRNKKGQTLIRSNPVRET